MEVLVVLPVVRNWGLRGGEGEVRQCGSFLFFMSTDAPKKMIVKGAATIRVGVVAARYNGGLVEELLGNVKKGLKAAGVVEKNVLVARVPGSGELPVAAQLMARGKWKADVLIALGVVIRGGTIHYELVAQSATDGLQRVALDEGLPVICGVVAVENLKQAKERCGGKLNRGAEFAQAAVEMAALRKEFSRTKK